jgi:sialic acid synthase SpsE
MNRPFIIAEISANHLGSKQRALDIIVAAHKAGADACKFQTFTPEQMVDADKVIEAGPWAGRKAIELYQEAHTPREWHPMLFGAARACGMVPLSSVFHPDDVDYLETLDCPIYKISSMEALDRPLIERAASTGKAMIMSMGMATWDEMAQALTYAHLARMCAGFETPGQMTLLKCTSAYPAKASEANLATMDDMRKTVNIHNGHVADVGLSDHTPGIGVAVAATALGATVIEKHLTLSRADGGPDAAFSMEPDEFAQMVIECRRAAAAIGTVQYGPTPGEAASMLLRRKPGGKRGD